MLKKFRKSALARFPERGNEAFKDSAGAIPKVNIQILVVETNFSGFHNASRNPEFSFPIVENLVEICQQTVDKLWKLNKNPKGKYEVLLSFWSL